MNRNEEIARREYIELELFKSIEQFVRMPCTDQTIHIINNELMSVLNGLICSDPYIPEELVGLRPIAEIYDQNLSIRWVAESDLLANKNDFDLEVEE